MCQCEDRPCCGCDADVYQPASDYDAGDYADSMRERAEYDPEGCDLCNTAWNDQDNEDDIVQGFHADCVE